MSNNNNFIVWYTTTGDSKTDYESAKKLADGLENTIAKYKKNLGYDYIFESKIVSKGKKYKDQVEILKQNNIDPSYLEKSMQVYLVNYTDTSLAKYTSSKSVSKLSDLAQKIYGSDIMGSIAFPYILIKPESFNDYETLEQLYNHEMFHHYQFEILCGHTNCDIINDELIFEGSANWASSLITEKTDNEGYLNNWAGTARNASDKLLSNELLNKHGKDTMGYALFVYLNNYSSYAKDGVKNIIDSIYEDDSLKYLFYNTSNSDLIKIQENIALKNITQDYNNKNLNASPSYGSKLPIADIITENSKNNNYNHTLSPIGIEYYYIDTNNNFEINLSNHNIYISLFIIKKENGKYSIIDNKEECKKECTLNTKDYKKYDELYIAVANTDLSASNEYSLTIRESSEVIEDTNEDEELFNATTNNFVSIKNCQIYIHDYDEIYGAVYTFYYDDDKMVNKLIGSIFLRENADVNSWYRYTKRDYGTVRFKNNNVLQFVYPQKYFDKVYLGRNIEDIIRDYGEHCADCMPDEDCPETYIVDYNPNE